MRKAGTILGAFALMSMVIALMGSVPEGKRLPAAIPLPNEGIPFIFIEGQGNLFASIASSPLPDDAGKVGPLLRGLRSLIPLLGKTEEAAVLFSLERGGLLFDGLLRYEKTVSESITRGEFPESWDIPMIPELSGNVPGLFILKGPSPLFPLYFCGRGDFILFGSSPEKIGAMAGALEKGNGGMAVAWEVEKRWPNHFLFFDGGLASHLASRNGIPVEPVGISVSGAWKENETGGRLKWKASGIESFFPGRFMPKILPAKWDDQFLALEPFIASFGINVPDIPPAVLEHTGASSWDFAGTIGLGENEMRALSAGPVMGSLCSSGKFLVFTLPGILFQFPGRGAAGEAFARSFWDQEWSSLVPAVEKIEGFHEGGTAAIPFSLFCAANADMLSLGIIDRDRLKPEKKLGITHFVPLLKEIHSAFFWAFIDGPALGEAIRSLARTGDIVAKIGRTTGINVKSVLRSSEALEKMGVLTLVMPSLNEGVLEWKPPQRH
jgi:hypothetical protein